MIGMERRTQFKENLPLLTPSFFLLLLSSADLFRKILSGTVYIRVSNKLDPDED